MFRTQLYLSDSERAGLQQISKKTGKSQSELIHMAVDQFIEHFQLQDRKALLRQAKGLWNQRVELPDFNAMRWETDRACCVGG